MIWTSAFEGSFRFRSRLAIELLHAPELHSQALGLRLAGFVKARACIAVLAKIKDALTPEKQHLQAQGLVVINYKVIMVVAG